MHQLTAILVSSLHYDDLPIRGIVHDTHCKAVAMFTAELRPGISAASRGGEL